MSNPVENNPILSFRVNLQSLLDARGMTYNDLANNIGLSSTAVSRYISGVREPMLTSAIAIADYFHVPLDWMCGRDEKQVSAGLTVEQQTLIGLFENASDRDKEVIRLILNMKGKK